MKMPNIKDLFKNFNLPKVPKVPEIKLPFKLSVPNLDKKTWMTIGAVVLVLIISVAGRKSPFGNDWESVLPDESIFDGDGGAQQSNLKEVTQDDRYTLFFFEVYDLIKERFWNVLSEEQLGNIVKLSVEKITGSPVEAVPTNKNQTRGVLLKAMSSMDDTQRKEFIVQLTDIMLANLEPFGRSRLYTSKKQQELTNTVKNIDPKTDHYEVLDVPKEAPPEEIETAYQEKANELAAQPQTEEVVQEKAKVEKAFEVLADEGNKNLYDNSGVNPTIPNRFINSKIFYLHIAKFSPTTVEELVRVMDKAEAAAGPDLDTLIIDLRGNIGGAIDGLPYFLGPFIGKDQQAYQFFSRGEKEDFKTLTGWLPSLIRYKKVVILTDDQVQSSGEVFAAALKKYNVGVIVGTATKGWGTVESVFKINNQLDPENETYSVLLVHSLTLREDGVPIEGKGVEPMVNTASANWQRDLFSYFHYQELVDVVGNLLSTPVN